MSIYSQFYIILMAIFSWTIAQILKLILELIVNKKLDFSRIVGAGGMPSVHTATVVALVAAIAKKDGFTSTGFAIAAVLTFVVVYDSINVRFEAGEHAKVLNTFFNWFLNKPDSPDMKLNLSRNRAKNQNELKLEEKLGHTVLEVSVGAIVGILTVLAFPLSF